MAKKQGFHNASLTMVIFLLAFGFSVQITTQLENESECVANESLTCNLETLLFIYSNLSISVIYVASGLLILIYVSLLYSCIIKISRKLFDMRDICLKKKYSRLKHNHSRLKHEHNCLKKKYFRLKQKNGDPLLCFCGNKLPCSIHVNGPSSSG